MQKYQRRLSIIKNKNIGVGPKKLGSSSSIGPLRHCSWTSLL